MPLNNQRPSSSSEDQSANAESSFEFCDSAASSGDQDSARQSFNSDCSSRHCTPSSSPPRVVSLDEIMEAGKDLFNLKLSHEIVMRPDVHVDFNIKPQHSLWNQVKENLHQAFWDFLEAELNNEPPKYEQALKLLEEFREILISFLNPGANRMKTQIEEVLDIELIRQQANNNAVDIQGLTSYVIATMGKLCAPMRNKEIRALQEKTDNVVTLLREIYRVLDLMKMDMVNFTIESIKPMLQQSYVEYERATFQQILCKTPTALNHTTSWITSALEELRQRSASPGETSPGPLVIPGPFLLLNTAFLRLLTWDFTKNPIPETWLTDEVRLQEIQQQLQLHRRVNEVLLIVQSTVGAHIQVLPFLSDRLKRMTTVLLDGMHKPDFNLDEALQSLSSQICSELNKSLAERDYPTLSPELQATLSGQICNINQKDNPVCTLVEDRIQQYFTALISDPKPQLKLEEVPSGLTAIKPELVLVGKMFITLVNYNKNVYGPFYADIIRKLMFSST